MEGAPHDEERWKNRRGLAMAVSVGVVAVPIACSVAVPLLIEALFERPRTLAALVTWWLAIVAGSVLAFLAVQRVVRQAVPLKTLLKMDMLFPGQAPKRLSVARRAASTRDLERRLAQARSEGLSDEPTLAAEQIVALAGSLRLHDRMTRGHAERVRAITDLIADELHLDTDQRDRLRWSALLHDIGKLAVHPDTLNKSGALSDEEWEEIRRHPLEGARITAPLAEWLGEWASTIAEHHERYDGRGYPHEFRGQDISLGGRIVAVADAYDVMTSIRAYKRAMAPHVARAEVAACAGGQFDPDIVRAFLGVPLRRLRAIAPLAWIASIPFGNALPQLGRLATLGGQTAAAGVISAAVVVGVHQAGSHAMAPQSTQQAASSAVPAGTHPASTAGTGQDSTGSDVGGTAYTHTSDKPAARGQTTASTGNSGNGGAVGTSSNGSAGSGSSGSASSGSGSRGSGSPSSGSTSTKGTSSTSAPSSATTTTSSKSSGPASTTTTAGAPPPPVSTTTTIPPPQPPTSLAASGGCQLVVIGPEIVLSWTPSTTGSVTGYTILRSTNGASYASVASVASRTTSGYTDTSVAVNTSYWYEVQAVSASGTASAGPAHASTPTLCL